MKDTFANLLNIFAMSIGGILAYMLFSVLFLFLAIEEGGGLIAVFILPVLISISVNKMIYEFSKTKWCYVLTSSIVVLYIISVMASRIVDFIKYDSTILWVIYNIVALFTIVLLIVRDIKAGDFHKPPARS